MKAAVHFPGAAEGPVLALAEPLSFWGGVDPQTGRVIAARHPQVGASIAGTILLVPSPIGSSSSSSVLLELIRVGAAPAGVVLGAPDAILVVGCLVGRELGYRCPPIVHLDAPLPVDAARLAIEADGRLRVVEEGAHGPTGFSM